MYRLEELESRRLLSIALPSIPARTFSVLSYGAVANGSTNNATAIQNAINAAKNAGGGTVEFPAAAQPYESGPINLASNVNFQVDAGAELQALPYSSYPGAGGSVNDFITAKNLTNFEISGNGTIDGNGSAWWTAYNNGTISDRPRLIQITNCNTLLIQGLTLQNSPQFHIAFGNTNTVTVNSVTINTSPTSPNTDGIDPAGQHYLIENCSISTGDDNIAIKPQDVFCGDITVTNCTFGAGHGMSVGGETNDGLNGLSVTDCTFDGTTAGVRLKASRGNGGLVQNCTYSNLTMTDVEYPININSYYSASVPSNPQDPAQSVTATTPNWQNISITNVTSSWDTTGGEYTNSYCGIIWGLPEEPINGITLTNVNLSAKYGVDVDHVRNMSFDISSHFTAAVGGALISTKTAATPYDADISEFADVTSDNQTVRLVKSGLVINYYANSVLLGSISPSQVQSFLVDATGDNDLVALYFSGGDFGLPISVDSAATSINTTLNVIGSSVNDSFTVNSSQLTHGSSRVPFSNIANLSLATGSYAFGGDLSGPGLQIGSGGTVQLAQDQHLASLAISGNGALNIGNQTVYLAETGSTADAAVFSLLQISQAANWAGPGIVSNLASPSNATSVGYFDNGSQIAIRYTWLGDANLDGAINADDISLLMLGQAQHQTDWFLGNFNYGPQIDADDWALLQRGAAEASMQALPGNTIADTTNIRSASDANVLSDSQKSGSYSPLFNSLFDDSDATSIVP